MAGQAAVEIDPEIAEILREGAAADLPDATTLPTAAARAQLTAASLAWNVDPPDLPVVAALSAPRSGRRHSACACTGPAPMAACRWWFISTAAAGPSARSIPTTA